jgi:hypothetical protein
MSDDTISRAAALDGLSKLRMIDTYIIDGDPCLKVKAIDVYEMLKQLPSTQSDIILCKDCKYWRRQTNYAGAPLSFGFCESDDMWRSLYGETYEVSHIDTDDDFYCGFAERREE